MLEHDGTVKWAVNPAIHENWGGQPSVGDVDGDGIPEIGVVSRNNYNLCRADGTIRWSRAITEQTSGQGASVFFDLNNDGRAEIVYADQLKLFIFRGADGTILNQFNRYSSTAGEGPSVADVDRDGHADILIAGDIAGLPEGRGIRMYSGANLNWANTRAVWNHDAYTITNINDDLTVPLSPRPNWLVPG
ncbi:MAG: VCBS repeat-containing protein, partial [Acidobacteria bacterium]|nr:VCBS repeat-containing protein [Acidobacteriota bacterium]